MVKANKNSGRVAGRGSIQKFSKPRPSSSKANAAGYEKRQSRKAKALAGLQTSDVYEYVPEKARRSKVGLDLDREEAAEFGTGLDGANDEEREALRARLIGENADDEMIDSEDDEELDSDAAFEESDEERFAGFFSSKGKKKALKKKKPVVRFADVDLNEEEEVSEGDDDDDEKEEEEEEGEDDEFLDLLDVLDGKGEMDMESDNETAPKSAAQNAERTQDDEGGRDEEQDEGSDQGSEEDKSEDEDEDEDEKMELAPSDDEDVSPEALDDLQNFVSTLDPTSKKRKAPEGTDAPDSSRDRTRKRRFIKERTEAGAENEFRVQSSSTKLDLDDLLAPLASQSSALLSLKKSTKILAPSSSSKAKTLSAPLPQRAQERLDREAAYEQTKQEVDKWSSTMKRIREAEHLSFPLQAERAPRISNMALASNFKPSTALESSVDALLKSAKIKEDEIQNTEESMLKMNKLSVEEVAQRRGELRKMRELMFRAEIKARRVGKIKSKTYRKIKRKERERLGEKIDEDEGSETEEGKLKREIERARERATLRHKHTGKWAKQMKHREDGEGRKEIEEMLSRGEKLRRRIRGVGSDESEGDGEESEDDHENEDVEGGIERIKQGAFEELRRVEIEDGSIQIEKSSKGKSVFEMKFMKDAMAKQQHAANKEVDDFIKEMGGQPEGLDDSDAEQEDGTQQLDPSSGVVTHRAGGRIVYRPGANPTASKERPLRSLASDTSSVTLKSTDLLSPPPPSPEQTKRPQVPFPVADTSNPWLVRDEKDVAVKAPRKNNDIIVGKDSKAADKSKNKLRKEARKREEERVKAKDDAAVEISMDKIMLAPSASTTATAPAKKAAKQTAARDADDDSDVNSEVEAQEKMLDLKGKGKANGLKAFEQRDLVARAFAGDNVVHDFEEAKRREITADAPKEVDTTIPGWGSWGGSGVRKTAPKPQRIKKIAGIDPTSRADFNKKHVIISEKRDKKAAKYLVKDLPYPYTSQAQFERSMERPLGAEWNTRVGFQRGTLPRVVKKPGVIINPLEKLT